MMPDTTQLKLGVTSDDGAKGTGRGSGGEAGSSSLLDLSAVKRAFAAGRARGQTRKVIILCCVWCVWYGVVWCAVLCCALSSLN